MPGPGSSEPSVRARRGGRPQRRARANAGIAGARATARSGERPGGPTRRQAAAIRTARSTNSAMPAERTEPRRQQQNDESQAISRPTPTPRSITTLVTALRQSQPSRTTSQARIASPVTLGNTWAKNTPIAVMRDHDGACHPLITPTSTCSTLRQRRATSGICSMTSVTAKAAQRTSSIANGG